MTHGVLAPQRSTFASRRTVSGSRGVGWVRPADWLAVPVPSASDQRFVGLAAVFPDGSNFITVQSGVAFKVDWGDGAGWVNYAAGVTAQKNLAWADYSSGTLTSRGYRQALVTVEAVAGNLTSLDLQQRHSSVPRTVASLWLDVAVSLPNGTLTFGGINVSHANVERVTVVGVTNTTFAGMFQNCSSLQSVPLFNTSNGTNFGVMFYGCSSLQSVPLFNTSNGTNFGSMFYGCWSLQSVPLFNTSSGTTFASMFQNCTSLQSVPLFNTSNGTNFSYMLASSTSLQSVPLFNTSNGTNLLAMFYGCTNLQSVPGLNTAAATNLGGIVQACPSLRARAAFTGTRYSIDYSGAMLSGPALDAIYTALGTAAGSQTITVTNNWGTATDNPSIATAKGWTVVGS